MCSEETQTLLQFTPASSFVQPSFWNKFSALKINVDKLSESHRKIWGYYSNTSTWATHVVEIDSTSFNVDFNEQCNSIPFHGKIFNKNSIEQFKDCDKNALLDEEGKELIENLKNGSILEKPSKLNTFFILSFSDLKKYHFYYWFAFPVPQNIKVNLNETSLITEEFSDLQLSHLVECYTNLNVHQKSYFLIENGEIYPFNEKLKDIVDTNYNTFHFALTDYTTGENCPKTQLKNYILFLLHYCPFLGGKVVKFVAFYLDRKLTCSQSLIYKVTLPTNVIENIYEGDSTTWVGWEKNEKGKFSPRFSNMKSVMDPAVLYEESVDLNLKLMKWRLLPEVNLEKIKETKFLLLGAGTLGCSVSRTLLGWGARNITFVDNSTVSCSNPVRQSLYTYEDAIEGKSKSETAAARLKKIFPAINAKGYNLTIPMPGHTVDDHSLEQVVKAVDDLNKLIQENDVIFLLMDSRESRWLPTLLSTYHEKIIMNVALGFDTYLVMRYGGKRSTTLGNVQSIKTPEGYKAIPGENLGCYFCNDVTAPGNSIKDRTLDQQCTVARPGTSAIAGGLAVELVISIIQHEQEMNAPAFYKSMLRSTSDHIPVDLEDQSILGILPHSIRGFLTNFTQVLPATPKYNQCIACSDIILDEYKRNGFEFLLKAFNSSKHLEDLTGLSSLLNENNFIDISEMGDDDDWES